MGTLAYSLGLPLWMTFKAGDRSLEILGSWSWSRPQTKSQPRLAQPQGITSLSQPARLTAISYCRRLTRALPRMRSGHREWPKATEPRRSVSSHAGALSLYADTSQTSRNYINRGGLVRLSEKRSAESSWPGAGMREVTETKKSWQSSPGWSTSNFESHSGRTPLRKIHLWLELVDRGHSSRRLTLRFS